jgi:UDP-N-acetylmuramate--alanine ligase
MGRLHFVGLAGSGMSALARYAAMRGQAVSGSDRAFDRGERADLRSRFESTGIAVHPQDGRGVGSDCTVVVSTAVEDTIPDLVRARETGVTVVHRSDLLARFVAERRTVAVAGTSGKSTVVAMTFEVLRAAGLDPSVLSGADLLCLGEAGNAWAGRGDLLVVEADESDGSLVRYEPAVAVVLNVSRDHEEVRESLDLFRTFAGRARERVVVGDDDALRGLSPGAIVFGLGASAIVRAAGVDLAPDGARFRVDDVAFRLPTTGRHEVSNALAAIAVCDALEVPRETAALALEGFRGVARRFRIAGRPRGVTVVDDYAHNPAKISAAIEAARLVGRRVFAVFQPHGYGPLRQGLADLAGALRSADVVHVLPVYYAGGTVSRDVTSADLAARIGAQAADRAETASRIARDARAGDLVLVMGARDATLTDFCRNLGAAIDAAA